jgi:hypothetical protein
MIVVPPDKMIVAAQRRPQALLAWNYAGAHL